MTIALVLYFVNPLQIFILGGLTELSRKNTNMTYLVRITVSRYQEDGMKQRKRGALAQDPNRVCALMRGFFCRTGSSLSGRFLKRAA